MARATEIEYGIGGYIPGAPNDASVPASVPPGNVTSYATNALAFGLGVDKDTIAANDTDAAVANYACYDEGTHVWIVDGEPATITPTFDDVTRLWWSEAEITATVAHTVEVSCNGETLTLEAS